jgi:hypothetical protein
MKDKLLKRATHHWLQVWLVAGIVCSALWHAGNALAQLPSAQPVQENNLRYTFSWPLESGLTPRGGTTRGLPVIVDTTPSSAWQALQADGISKFERDRRAILAMACSYRATFDFLEVLRFNDAGAQRPYQSWGTEKVYVDSDTGSHISLVHILEMRVVQEDGSVSEPIVMKHWRQDWQYQPETIVEYQGNDAWRRRAVTSSERKGRWAQTVYQVDESPRYGGLGVWQHEPLSSTWISADTWRPLPRREWSVRKDYNVLLGSNRHTITATGWVQEENNLKTVLAHGQTQAIAREYGFARYERIKDFDFTQADDYYAKTRSFWNEVGAAWSDWFKRDTTIQLRGQVDQLALFVPLFEHADAIVSDPSVAAKDQTVIRDALHAMRP